MQVIGKVRAVQITVLVYSVVLGISYKGFKAATVSHEAVIILGAVTPEQIVLCGGDKSFLQFSVFLLVILVVVFVVFQRVRGGQIERWPANNILVRGGQTL